MPEESISIVTLVFGIFGFIAFAQVLRLEKKVAALTEVIRIQSQDDPEA